ncbi:hypothetical protein EIO_0141 [Ketogulonicigenium vulgare Y25]|uniref:Uncharacterized protein n=1 Tax=Ketogulonicigenium vulgare (strain WSH-001) TaxID=759362 RepID=F9Y9P1_KETVW|nr:hypothetical protein EIO_0141 [Ketogulonicigenium vulgare Y25]AEM41379.1 hypothetical protein KVU_1539 [Ketogulonicigenium vulgare WSH-001]ALJ82363.1 hypothetical protein KVH_10220 [Ketogulonicigenium vulgare]ANW35103.1 hypothetical protein KvSKV_10165 [Ketogulonicigenium vulgare]AOZ55124.1 hypothetical protein KVC_2117 [Ketogulonicigenium vulgare]
MIRRLDQDGGFAGAFDHQSPLMHADATATAYENVICNFGAI